jgi:hypothetical protein
VAEQLVKSQQADYSRKWNCDIIASSLSFFSESSPKLAAYCSKRQLEFRLNPVEHNWLSTATKEQRSINN